MAANGIMAFPEINHFTPRQKNSAYAAAGFERGAITVEYALCMVVAAALMLGVQVMFNNMAQEIINRFKDIVLSFPTI